MADLCNQVLTQPQLTFGFIHRLYYFQPLNDLWPQTGICLSAVGLLQLTILVRDYPRFCLSQEQSEVRIYSGWDSILDHNILIHTKGNLA